MPGYSHRSFEELRIEDEEISTDLGLPNPATSPGELLEEEQE